MEYLKRYSKDVEGLKVIKVSIADYPSCKYVDLNTAMFVHPDYLKDNIDKMLSLCYKKEWEF